MVKDSNFMNEVKSIILESNGFDDHDFCYPYSIEVSDGSSCDGFINYTDGFVDIRQPYVPFCDDFLDIKGDNLRKIISSMWKELYDDFYNDEEIKEKYPEFENAEAFKKWHENYQPYRTDPTIPLFEDIKAFSLNSEYDKLYNDYYDYRDSYYNDSPAYIGVKVYFYDHANGNKSFYVCGYINDDFGYGRESVGRWAKLMGIQSADGSSIGDHAAYENEVEYIDNDLKEKLTEEVRKAFESIDCKYIS